MKYKSSISHSLPRLLIETVSLGSKEYGGFLQTTIAGEKILIGTAESREFRLVQCLFSPRNFISAKYDPVHQTYERVAAAMNGDDNVWPVPHAAQDNSKSSPIALVQKSLRKLQGSSLGEFLSFMSTGESIRMEVVSVV